MSQKVLFVDDDQKILNAIERQFDDDFDLEFAVGPHAGLEAIEQRGPFAVVISDMRMPEMTGIEMLTKIREQSPDTVRMMLTGFADLDTTIEAINQGNIFRFLSKPCSDEILELAINDGLRQYNLLKAEKELVEGTLMGSVKVLSDVLGLVNPIAFGRASRVKRISMAIAQHMQLADAWEVEIAAMLSAIGCVTLSEATLEKLSSDGILTGEERVAFEKHPDIGRSLLENIPRLGNVADIVAYQEKEFDGGGVPNDNVAGEAIPLGARILKVALDFDTHENQSDGPVDALNQIRLHSRKYDLQVVEALEAVVDSLFELDIQEVTINGLRPGRIFAADVMNTNGQLLIAKGQEITESSIRLLVNYSKRGSLTLPLRIF